MTPPWLYRASPRPQGSGWKGWGQAEMPTGSNCETLGPLKAIVSTSDPSLAFPRGGLWDPGTTMLPFLGGRSPQDHLEKRGGSQGLLDGHQGRGAIPE